MKSNLLLSILAVCFISFGSFSQTALEGKRVLVSKLIGEHKLDHVSYFSGANTLGSYQIINGEWHEEQSSIYQGQREGYTMEIKPDDVKRLSSMKIIVAKDLSISLSCNGITYLTSPFIENGMELFLSKSTKEYNFLPDELNSKSTVINYELYFLAKDNIPDSVMSDINIAFNTADVLMIKYDLVKKEFVVKMAFDYCCDNSTYIFR